MSGGRCCFGGGALFLSFYLMMSLRYGFKTSVCGATEVECGACGGLCA